MTALGTCRDQTVNPQQREELQSGSTQAPFELERQVLHYRSIGECCLRTLRGSPGLYPEVQNSVIRLSNVFFTTTLSGLLL